MIDLSKPFFSVSEAAEITGVTHPTITSAVEAKRLPALQLGASHAATRIPRTALFPEEQTARDLRFERLRKQFADVLRTQETTARKLAEYLDAHQALDQALRALADELAMADVAAARDALQKVG